MQTYRAVMKKLDAYSPLGYSCVGEVIGIGGQRSEVRGQRSEGGGQKSEVRDQNFILAILLLAGGGYRMSCGNSGSAGESLRED